MASYTLKWDTFYFELAKHIATQSKDPSTKVGCVITNDTRQILATGYNGFPRGIADDSRLHDRESKYPIICHAEENAIVQGAYTGTALRGGRLYCTLLPCARCARLIIQAGISTVIAPREFPERWEEDIQRAQSLLREGGLQILHVGDSDD